MQEGWGTANPTLCLATYDCFVDSVDGVRLTARLRELSALCANRKSAFDTTRLMQRKIKFVLLHLCK